MAFLILFWSNFIRNVNCYAIPKNFTNFFFFSFLLGRIADPVDGSWIANPERLYAKIRRLEFWHPGLGNSHIRYVEQTTAGFLLFHMTYEQVGCYSHSYHKKKIYIFQMHSNGKNFLNENNKKMGGGDIDNPPGFSFEWSHLTFEMRFE